MGRLPKPDHQATGLSSYPTPTPVDYSDEVSDADYEALRRLVRDSETGDGEEWEPVDEPAW